MPRGRPTKRQSYVHEEMRAKIKTTLLAKKLTEHVEGKVKMEPSQVTAALGLLKKTLPDLAAVNVEHSGSVNVVGSILSSIDGLSKDINGYGSADEETEKPTIQ